MPTRSPCAARAAARLTVTLDFPTPPLPLATAYTRVSDDGLVERYAATPAGTLQAFLQCVPLRLVHHAELDLDAVHAVDARERGLGVPPDRVTQRAAGDGQEHPDAHGPAVDGHGLEHPEFIERAAQFGVDHRGQRCADGRLGGQVTCHRDGFLPVGCTFGSVTVFSDGLRGFRFCRTSSCPSVASISSSRTERSSERT
ncbi:hypothetical protein QFZ50_002066 [Arthrobacter agilis]|nr:hypothetical protein [Arthrobacter agilis]